MAAIFATVLGFSDFAVIAWLIIVLAGATAFSTRKSSEDRRIERKLDALLKHHGIAMEPHAGLSDEVQRLARDPSQRISAIKLHRKETGLGLADAKADIEDFVKSVEDFKRKIQ
jgi:ribosomal protein L7/L12